MLPQGVREVEEWMSQTSGIPLEELRPHMFLLRDRDATGHLMRSASPSCTIQALEAVSIGLTLQLWDAWQLMSWQAYGHWKMGSPILQQGCAGCASAVHALAS